MISQAKPFSIPAVVQYVKQRPFTVSISANGLVGEKRIYDRRLHIRNVPSIRQIQAAEVIVLQPDRLEAETEYRSVLNTYYLPKVF